MNWRMSKALMAIAMAFVMIIETPFMAVAEDSVPAAEPVVQETSATAAEPASEPASQEDAAPASEPAAEPAPAPQEETAPAEPAAELSPEETVPLETELHLGYVAAPEETISSDEAKENVAGDTAIPETPAAAEETIPEEPATPAEGDKPEAPAGSENPEGGIITTAPADSDNTGSEILNNIDPEDIEIVKGRTEYSSDSVTLGDLTTVVKGLPDDEYETILQEMAVNIALAIDGDEAYSIFTDAVIDAEKYSTGLPDYDSQLCWAATASNMLWDSGFAQEAVNPYTGEYFANVDEVFDYFRKNFTDEAGVPDGAIEYFFKGTYSYTGVDGVSQLRDPEAETGNLLPTETMSMGMVDQESTTQGDTDILSTLKDLVNVSAGAWLRWWNSEEEYYAQGAHWLTIVGLTKDDTETDFTEKYKGIILADSDNTPVRTDSYSGESEEVRAQKASAQPNSYNFFNLSWENIDGKNTWVIKDYLGEGSAYKAILGAVFWLADRVIPRPPVNPGKDDDDDNPGQPADNPATEEDIYEVPAAVDVNIDEIKAVMVENDIIVYSPTDSKYNSESNDDCTLYVRKLWSSLLNVYIDGTRLSENEINFRIERLPNGLFRIVLSRELMKNLKKGNHELLLDFGGEDSINVIIVVE